MAIVRRVPLLPKPALPAPARVVAGFGEASAGRRAGPAVAARTVAAVAPRNWRRPIFRAALTVANRRAWSRSSLGGVPARSIPTPAKHAKLAKAFPIAVGGSGSSTGPSAPSVPNSNGVWSVIRSPRPVREAYLRAALAIGAISLRRPQSLKDRYALITDWYRQCCPLHGPVPGPGATGRPWAGSLADVRDAASQNRLAGSAGGRGDPPRHARPRGRRCPAGRRRAGRPLRPAARRRPAVGLLVSGTTANVTHAGITADLEAMKPCGHRRRAHHGTSSSGSPRRSGPATFMSDTWQGDFQFALSRSSATWIGS